MSEAPTRYHGACHCKAVRFSVTLPEGLSSVGRCNCSICRMRGTVVAWAWRDGMEVTQGADKLQCYTFNTGVARHYFCSVCGIYTHHLRRYTPDKFSVNVACLDGVSPFDFAALPVSNGRDHVLDGGAGRVDPVGRVIYESFEQAARPGEQHG